MRRVVSCLCMAIVWCAGVTAGPKEDGLVAHYTCADGAGNILRDASGNGNDGKIVGAQWVRGPKGVALDFDGAGDQVNCGDTLGTRFRGPMTVTAWVRPVSTPLQYIVTRGDWALAIGANGAPEFQAKAADDTQPSIWMNRDSYPAQARIPANEWTFLAAVYDTERKCVEVFVNGSLSASAPKTDGFIGGIFRNMLVLGQERCSGCFNGLLGETRLYSKALTAEAMERIYASSRPDPDLAPPRYRVRVRPHLVFAARKILAEISASGTEPLQGGMTCDVVLSRPDAKAPLTTEHVTLAGGGTAEAAFSLDGLPAGEYEIRARLNPPQDAALVAGGPETIAPDAEPLATATARITVPEKPAWYGSKAGISDTVLPPWTPLTVNAADGEPRRIGCWGRTYEFLTMPFPEQITTGQKALLAAPIRLAGRVAGREISWKGNAVEPQETSPARVTLSQTASDGALALSATVQIEYDGMIRVDFQIAPVQTARLEALTLEIPLRREHARLLYQYRDAAFKAPGALPKDGLARNFNPAVWLGDHERGLQWFSESDENWFLADPNKAIEIVPGQDQVTLRLNLVSTPIELRAGARLTPKSAPQLKYTFGLQATPVKPITKTSWDYRTVGTPVYNNQYALLTDEIEGKPGLDYYRDMGVKTVFLTISWTDIFGYPLSSGHSEELHRMVKACHDRGMQIMLYLGSQFTDRTPEYPAFLDDFTAWRRPGVPYPYGMYYSNTPPGITQEMYTPCIRSEWRNFIVDGWARTLEEFDVDGVYLDGIGVGGSCCNPHHGCGYVRPDGKAGMTYPIFAGRDVIRRLYTLMTSRKPDGQVELHAASFWLAPVTAWATNVWDGETILGDRRTPPQRKGLHILDYLPLEQFCVQFLGKPWGVSSELLSYYIPYPYARIYAMALLHDLPIRANQARSDLPFIASIWRTFDAFGRKDSEWLPYWRNAEYVTAGPEGAYVSLYRHPRNGVVAVVSNLGREKAQVSVRFALDKLGLPPNAAAVNALSHETVPFKNGAMTLDLDSIDWKLLWIRP